MRSLPLDTSVMTFLVVSLTRAEERTNPDDFRSPMRPKVTADGEPMWKLQCLVKVDNPDVEDADELRGETLDVTITGEKPSVGTLNEVEFEGLAARPWTMGTNSGVSFSARSVRKAGSSSNGRKAEPVVQAS